tara:strand:- start:1587 stop:2153 length:567 start_codon:yes stop_codon:yes gene_type:complete
MSTTISTQNDLLLKNLMVFYKKDNNLKKMLDIINGESRISLRIVDWFATNYAKMNFSVYNISINGRTERFNVYRDYKLKLKAYSKKRFDPFCRWDRINIPYGEDPDKYIQTTIGQLNFFKWALENNVVKFIEQHFSIVEQDMNERNSTAKNKTKENGGNKTRKKREELSISAVKTVKKENVEIIVKFD